MEGRNGRGGSPRRDRTPLFQPSQKRNVKLLKQKELELDEQRRAANETIASLQFITVKSSGEQRDDVSTLRHQVWKTRSYCHCWRRRLTDTEASCYGQEARRGEHNGAGVKVT